MEERITADFSMGTVVEERRLFTPEERKQILKKTGGICACCGKKLKSSSMAIEHVIPHIRGGLNDMVNLIPLCYPCNERKGNIFFWPSTYYLAIRDKSLIHQLDGLAKEWAKTHIDINNIKWMPLIAPCHSFSLLVPTAKKAVGYVPDSFIDIQRVDKPMWATITAISGITRKDADDMMNNTEIATCGFYVMKKRTNDKFLALYGIKILEDSNDILFYELWNIVESKEFSIYFFYRIIVTLINTWLDIGRKIGYFTVSSNLEGRLKEIESSYYFSQFQVIVGGAGYERMKSYGIESENIILCSQSSDSINVDSTINSVGKIMRGE